MATGTADLERRLRAATDAKVRRDFHQVNVARLRGQLAAEEASLAQAEDEYRAAERAADEACVPGALRRVA